MTPSNFRPCALRRDESGTVLLIVMIVVFMIVGLSAVMLKRNAANITSFQQSQRETQSGYGAESAISIAISELNNDLVNNHEVGTLGHPENDPHSDHRDSGAVVITSSDSGRSPIPLDTSYSGHPLHDRFDNDVDGEIDEPDEEGDFYSDIHYWIRIGEWNTDPNHKIGAVGMDDDADGQVDEPGETDEISTPQKRMFTIKVSATYFNYTTEMTAAAKGETSSGDTMGMYAFKDFQISNNSFFDSYRSSRGAYGSGPTYDNMEIATEQVLQLKPGNTIKGTAKWKNDLDVPHPTNFEANNETELYSDQTLGTTKAQLEEMMTRKKTVVQRDMIFPDNGKMEVPKNDSATLGDGEHQEGVFLNEGATLNISDDSEVVIGSSDLLGDPEATVNLGENSTLVMENNFGLASRGTLNVEDGAEIIVQNDFKAKKQFDMNVTGKLKMTVLNNFHMEGQDTSIKSSSGKPGNIDIRVGGTWIENNGNVRNPYEAQDGDVQFKPGFDIEASIYAPGAPVLIEGKGSKKGHFYGSLIGGNVQLGNNLGIHYDEDVGSECTLPQLECSFRSTYITSWVTDQRGGSLKGY